jgi:DNA repair protein RadA/Sms
LLVTGEESLDQVALRAARLGIPLDRVRAIATTSFEAALATATKERPDVVVVDSIQTMEQRDLGQPAGSIVQVRECAAGLVRFAKDSGTTTVLTGHVTKEGAVAGPKVLEHVVDITLALLGERDGTIRILRAGKNRFGSCEETGVFSMTERGLEGVTDPSTMLMADRCVDVAGSAVFPGLEGSRPLLVELQALVPDAAQQLPRYHAIGLDARRLSLLIGVLKEHAKTDFKNRDVFAAAAGGIAIKEPGADLALCLALHSSITTTPLDSRLVAVGEVGLSGELRRVSGLDRRLKEAARLGFTRAIVPQGNARISSDLEICTARSVSEAFTVAGREEVAV